MDPNEGTGKRCDECQGPQKIKETLADGRYLLDCGHVVVPEHKKYGP